MHSLCQAFPHIMNIHQFKIPVLHKYFDNQEYITPIQYAAKNIIILPFLAELQLKYCIPLMLNLI
jgi:hypothetical protein